MTAPQGITAVLSFIMKNCLYANGKIQTQLNIMTLYYFRAYYLDYYSLIRQTYML